MVLNFRTDENQIIFGSILGDMSLIKRSKNSRPHFEETHSIIQKDYLYWKLNKIKSFDVDTKIIKKYDNRYNRHYQQVMMISKVSDDLEYFYNLFFKNNKKTINARLLSYLGPLALAVWYCDDGSYDFRRKGVGIATQSFSKGEHVLIKTWFKRKWKIDCRIKKHYKKYCLIFDRKNSMKFLKLIQNQFRKIPISMHYKLGTFWIGNSQRFQSLSSIISKYRKNYRIRNRHKIKIYSKKYYEKNKRRINKRRQEYYYKNRDREIRRSILYNKIYRRKNKEKINSYKRKYYALNKDKFKEYNLRYRTKM